MNAHPEILANLSEKFRTGMKNNFNVFGKNAFRKYVPNGQRRMINAALWDVMSTGLARYPLHVVEERSEDLRSAFYNLLEDEEFDAAITLSTNTVRNVIDRFSAATEMFVSVFNAQ